MLNLLERAQPVGASLLAMAVMQAMMCWLCWPNRLQASSHMDRVQPSGRASARPLLILITGGIEGLKAES
uniref:hypothetical protein n=1 Tax=Pseudomonas sp. Z003-0.4C(8344-21) TaxID=1855380 RepID=UPI000A72AFD5|nr:hypothetical protein [Pseudomonas sp. Z003-0.4C(8344-21)]